MEYVYVEQLLEYFTYIGIQLLILVNTIKTYLDINYNNLYKYNDIFHRCIDTLEDYLYHFKRLILPYYVESPFSYYKVCYNDRLYKEEYINVDNIMYNTKTANTLDDVVSTYKKVFSLIKPMIKHNELDYLVLIHYRNMTDDYIISRLMFEYVVEDERIVACHAEPTRNYFLSIEYQHPSMTNTITIKLDKRYLVTGNELFSPCFVLKCLNYQKEPYVFDKHYKLLILDSDINNTTICGNQYIKLSNTGYDVFELFTTAKK